jgi:hypothetical protein
MARATKPEVVTPDRDARPWRALVRGLRQYGGLRQTFRGAVNLARSEGWAGVCRGFTALAHAVRRQGGDGRNDYEAWVARYDTLTDAQRTDMCALVADFAERPTISIIMPVYNPAPLWLEAAIQSVCKQLYPHWELCIADDASTDPAVRDLLVRYAALDDRIHVVFRERNGHISEASNTALGLASGAWVALFDHDDLLAEHALFWVAEAINRHPLAALIYSDEDKITDDGVRCVPHFKPDWNHELFLSYNLICHLGLYRRDLVERVGGFRKGYEGAQDYDLALRCVERIAPHQIIHVPRILYHWRMHAASTAMGGQSKPYAVPAGQRALDDHFRRREVKASAEFQPTGVYQTRFAAPAAWPDVSVLVVGEKTAALSKWFCELTAATDYPDLELVSVSGAGEARWFQRAVDGAKGEVILLLRSGLMPHDRDWLKELVLQALQPGVGAVGGRTLDHAGRIRGTAAIFGLNGQIGIMHRGLNAAKDGYFHRAAVAQVVSALLPDCVAVRKLHVAAAGVPDAAEESALPAAFVDLCLRLAESGLRNIYLGHQKLMFALEPGEPDTTLPALAGLSPAARRRLEAVLTADPAYNPNLSLLHEDFSLAWPPRYAAISSENAEPCKA